MALNKLAAFRYRILDECFQQKGRLWPIQELIEIVSERLLRHHDIQGGVNKRTIESDIALMRLPPPRGYDAPIKSIKKKGYFYDDPDFSIEKKPLTGQDRKAIRHAIDLLKQFRGLPHFLELEKILQKVEGKIRNAGNGFEAIQFESNDQVAGLNWLERIFTAIESRTPLQVTYQAFMAKESSAITFHPYLLKEYRNRWFAFGQNEEECKIYCLALDRIQSARLLNPDNYYRNPVFHPTDWFKDIIGVTRHEDGEVTEIIFTATPLVGYYIQTKPLHPSQQTLRKDDTGWQFSLRVIPNYELRAELLRFGNEVNVEQPINLFGG